MSVVEVLVSGGPPAGLLLRQLLTAELVTCRRQKRILCSKGDNVGRHGHVILFLHGSRFFPFPRRATSSTALSPLASAEGVKHW